MNRTAYTAFVAFWTAVIVLVAVGLLARDRDPSARSDERLRVITLDELARHNHPESCWKVIHGKVYDVTEYVPLHPTHPEIMYEWCGLESTEVWDTKGYGRPHTTQAAALLEKYLIGQLESGRDQP